MTRAALVLALAGIALATALVAREGAATVFEALAATGAGVVWSSALHAVPMTLNARAWKHLVGGGGRRRTLGFFTWLVWVREAVNGLLPVARVGGEVAAARLMIRRGVPAGPAVASLAGDTTISLATQGLFTLVGLALLAGRGGSGVLARAGGLSLAVAVAVVAILAVVLRRGLFETLGRVARAVAGGRLERLAVGGRRTDRALRAVSRRPRRVLGCAAWQLAGWLAGAGEICVWLVLLGAGFRPYDAVVIEALVQAASSAAFVVPGALGVQEGAFLALGTAVGLPPDVSLALAIFRRARDLIVFVPALLLWQGQEGRSLFAARE